MSDSPISKIRLVAPRASPANASSPSSVANKCSFVLRCWAKADRDSTRAEGGGRSTGGGVGGPCEPEDEAEGDEADMVRVQSLSWLSVMVRG
jgi:hypothetical protein